MKLEKTEWIQIGIMFILFATLIVVGFTLYNSTKATKNAEEQFKILNQGYLDMDLPIPTFHTDNIGDNNIVVDNLNDTIIRIDGIRVEINLENAGNIPLKYKTNKFKMTIDGNTKQFDSDTLYTTGILFPNKAKSHKSSYYYFEPRGKSLLLKDIKKMIIIVEIGIEYYSANEFDKIKYLDRQFQIFIYDNHTSTLQLSINDSF